MAEQAEAVLNYAVISPSDLKRAERQLEALDDFMNQAAMRSGGEPTKMPQSGHIINELAAELSANLLVADDRKRLIEYVKLVQETAPVLHISFASEPSPNFMYKIITWLRANIHPQVLVKIGLQPSIAAGCIVRTTNKQFDFSLASAFDKNRALLINGLRGEQQ
jgi:hypothetical protein